MSISVKKINKHFYFFLKGKILRSENGNRVKVINKKIAITLSTYLSRCYSGVNKEKKFFLQMLSFNYELNKKNKIIFIDKMISFLSTDLVCYRAEKGSEISKIQKKIWDPLLEFTRKKYNLILNTSYSVMPIEQNPKNNGQLIKFLKKLDNKNFTFYYYMTNFCNSNIIALNFLANNIKSKYVWESISVDEIYSLKKWGSDKEIIDNLMEKKNYFKEIIKFKLIFNI